MRIYRAALFAGASLLACSPALAQTTPGATAQTDVSTLGEIVVTAQKRSEAISDVGITITAASSEQLQAAGVTDVTSLTSVVPGLSVAKSFAG